MLKVAIISCGNIFTMHATSAHHLKNAQIVAVCNQKERQVKHLSFLFVMQVKGRGFETALRNGRHLPF